jgi:hypothetical protein
MSKVAETYPESIYAAPPNLTSGQPGLLSSSSPAPGAGPAPALALRAGGYELSVGGAAGAGLYRSGNSDMSLQLGGGIAHVGEGIRDGAGRLWGNVKQRMEERASRGGTPPAR